MKISPAMLINKKCHSHWQFWPHNVNQFSSVAQSCLTLFDSMDCSMPGLPVNKGSQNCNPANAASLAMITEVGVGRLGGRGNARSKMNEEARLAPEMLVNGMNSVSPEVCLFPRIDCFQTACSLCSPPACLLSSES